MFHEGEMFRVPRTKAESETTTGSSGIGGSSNKKSFKLFIE
jgi:hypothetical protein